MHQEYFQEVTFCFKKKFPISAGNYYVFFFSLAKDRLVSKKFDLLFLLTLIVLLTITAIVETIIYYIYYTCLGHLIFRNVLSLVRFLIGYHYWMPELMSNAQNHVTYQLCSC